MQMLLCKPNKSPLFQLIPQSQVSGIADFREPVTLFFVSNSIMPSSTWNASHLSLVCGRGLGGSDSIITEIVMPKVPSTADFSASHSLFFFGLTPSSQNIQRSGVWSKSHLFFSFFLWSDWLQNIWLNGGLLLLCLQLYLWGSPFLGEIFAYMTVFKPTTEVVTFRLHGWYPLGVFSLPAFTTLGHVCQDNNNNRIQRRYSRFFTISSQRRKLSPTCTLKWHGHNRVNPGDRMHACVHWTDLRLYSRLKEF